MSTVLVKAFKPQKEIKSHFNNSMPRKIFTFCILVSVFSNTVAETYIIPVLLLSSKIFQNSFVATTRFLFTPHQMSIQFCLEAMHHCKIMTGQPHLPFLPSTQSSCVKSSYAQFFPHLENI